MSSISHPVPRIARSYKITCTQEPRGERLMAEEESSSGRSHPVSRIDGQSRSFSALTIPDEDGRGRRLEAASHHKPRDLHPSLRNDLYPASINPLKAHSTVTTRPPPLDFGQATRTTSSASVLGSSDRLRPLTPIHTKNSGTMFTTSPASSDLGSPRLPGVRSSSNTSLNRFQGPVHYSPCPPTPAAKKGQGGRTSSIPRRSPNSRKLPSSRPGTPHPHGKPSVKHLTCFWWKEKGDCRFREEDCLYAHHDTGLYADPPRQVIPGEPAMAGRSLDRALKKLHSNHNKSSSSLKSMSSEVIHADNASRPGTPGTEPPMSSAILEQLKGVQNAYAAAKSDNAFLRTLIEQNTKEKAVLVTAVETLQAESKTLKEENRNITAEKDQLKEERDLLRVVVSQLQTKQRQTPTSNPFGPIGSTPGFFTAFRTTRASDDSNTNLSDVSTQPLAELDKKSDQVADILKNLGRSF